MSFKRIKVDQQGFFFFGSGSRIVHAQLTLLELCTHNASMATSKDFQSEWQGA